MSRLGRCWRQNAPAGQQRALTVFAGDGNDLARKPAFTTALADDMQDLMNKVTEAKRAAEANLIVRREETAAMRSHANTAKVLAAGQLKHAREAGISTWARG